MIVNCVAYERGQKLSDISISEIRKHLSAPDCFVWVALKDAEPAELAALGAMVLADAYLVYRFKKAKWM